MVLCFLSMQLTSCFLFFVDGVWFRTMTPSSSMFFLNFVVRVFEVSRGPFRKFVFGWTSDGEVSRGWFRLLVFEVSRGRIRVASFRCPEFALVLFKSIFVEPLESFVLLFVRLVFKTRRVE